MTTIEIKGRDKKAVEREVNALFAYIGKIMVEKDYGYSKTIENKGKDVVYSYILTLYKGTVYDIEGNFVIDLDKM